MVAAAARTWAPAGADRCVLQADLGPSPPNVRRAASDPERPLATQVQPAPLRWNQTLAPKLG